MGGGGKTTTTSRDPALTAAATKILNMGLDAGDAGNLSRVAGASDLQTKAFGAAGGAYKQASGPDEFDENGNRTFQSDSSRLREQASQPFGQSAAFREGQQALGLSNFGGNPTGGRNRLAQGAIGADASAKYQDRQNNLLGQASQLEAGALSGLTQLGGIQRGVTQEGLDSENKKIQALGGLLQGTSGGFGQSQTTGGK